jgi:hypothetical protein
MLSSITISKKETGIPSECNYKLDKFEIRPLRTAVHGLNIMYPAGVLEINRNDNRIYEINGYYYSEKQITTKYIKVDSVEYIVLHPDLKSEVNYTAIETNLVLKYIGEYKLPDVNFKSSLFKPGTSYLCIVNGEMKVANSFSDLPSDTDTIIVLYESAYILGDLTYDQMVKLVNKNTSFLSYHFNKYEMDRSYFPYIQNEEEPMFYIQNKVCKIYPSNLEAYNTAVGFTSIPEMGSDVMTKYDAPPSIILDLSDLDSIPWLIRSIQSYNDNLNYDNFVHTKLTIENELKLMYVKDIDGVLRYYYGQPFRADNIYIYEGKLYDNIKIVRLKPATGISGEVTRSLVFTHVLFPIDIVPSKLLTISPCDNTNYSYTINGDGILETSDERELMFPDTIKIFNSFDLLSYKKITEPEKDYLLNLDYESLVIIDKNGLYELAYEDYIGSIFPATTFAKGDYLNISLPEKCTVIANRTSKLVDVTNMQSEDLLARGIVIAPSRYHLLFINGRIVHHSNMTKLFEDVYMINTNFYPYAITSVKVFLDYYQLYGVYNYLSFTQKIGVITGCALENVYNTMYPIRDADPLYSGDNVNFEPSDNLNGVYDRFYNFLISSEMEDILKLPEGSPKFDQALQMIKRSFSEINNDALELLDNDERICIPGGGPNHRYNIFNL